MHYKIKDVADMVGMSIRMLHHYDKIGLLKPESHSSAGYRLYSDTDLERLQQILFFRELDFGLQEIKQIMDSPNFDRKKALLAQKDLLQKKRLRLDKVIGAIDQTITSLEGGSEMRRKDMFSAFDISAVEEHKSKYAAEVREKYGAKAIESEKKTANYTKDDWSEAMTKAGAIYERIANDMNKGPAHPDVQQAVGEWRTHITQYFYECTLEIFRGLGDLYVQDQRFTDNIDKIKPGLAKFLQEAMHIYCDNQ